VPIPRKTLQNKAVSAPGGSRSSNRIAGPSHVIPYNDENEVEELELCAAKPATHHSPVHALRESVQNRPSAYGGGPRHPTHERFHTPARRNIMTEFNEASRLC